MPPPSRRSKLETCLDILSALAKRPMGTTRLSLEANVNHAALKGYLDLLISQGLVSEGVEGRGGKYYITERGLIALNYFVRLREMVRVEKLVIREAA
ncbi:MAG: winged helix-turn-helix domain-containing protein [Candidatus Nezhaarchaeota archaeon]|nr:winged helix-turn-helix domain-containing protein [Candidatus Nezhaarchaeota archaeon]